MKKKFMILSAIALLAGGVQTASAQNWRYAPQYHFGIRAGIADTTPLESWDGSNTTDFWGPIVGVAFDTKVAKLPFYIETGAYVMNRGWKRESEWDGSSHYEHYSHTENNSSLLIPALFSYHAYASKNVAIQPFMGPYYAWSFDKQEDDYGWRFGCGLSVKRFYVNMGFDLGIKDNFDSHEGRVSSFFMAVGWNFLGKR